MKKIDFASIGLFTLTTLFSLLLLEIVMRYYIFGVNAFSYSQMKSLRHVGVAGLFQASEHLDILWELKPNLDTHYKLWPFKTNSMRLRDKEYSLEKPANTFRIAVIGDSFTMAEGVPIESAYHSVLEERFNELHKDKKYEFINFGVAGYSLVQYVSVIKKKALEFKPDAILIGFCAANDSKLPNMEAFKKPYKVKPETNGFYHFHSLSLLGDVYKKYYRIFRNRVPGENADPDYVYKNFKELSEISAKYNIPILIAYISNISSSVDFQLIQDAAQKYDLELVDATGPFGKEFKNEHIIYLTDRHPSIEANRLMADDLYPKVLDFVLRVNTRS